MSRQRSSPSTSGRGSQSGTSRTSATAGTSSGTSSASSPTSSPQGELQGGGLGGGQMGGQTAGQTGGVVGQAKERTQELAGQVQQKATQRVESGLARGKTQAAETLNTVAQSLISTGQQLREQNQEPISRYVDQAADRVQRVSNYLQSTDVSEIVDRTEEFARRRPALFLGGAFALGLLGARFLKSSRRQQGQQTRNLGYAGTGTARNWTAGTTDFADVRGTDLLAGSQGQSGAGRQGDPLDYALPRGGPEAPQY